jgi:hypothetical protein
MAYYVFVFAGLGIQHALHMRHITCGLSCSTIFFSILSQKGTIFGKEHIEHKIGVLMFCKT